MRSCLTAAAFGAVLQHPVVHVARCALLVVRFTPPWATLQSYLARLETAPGFSFGTGISIRGAQCGSGPTSPSRGRRAKSSDADFVVVDRVRPEDRVARKPDCC